MLSLLKNIWQIKKVLKRNKEFKGGKMINENLSDRELTEVIEGFFFGDDIVVFPVMEKGMKQMKIELPEGNWYSFTDNTFCSKNSIIVDTPIEDMPIFAKSGSFIPTVLPSKNMEEYSSEFLTVNYYFDESIDESTFTMYEDDGKTNLSWQNKQFELITYNFSEVDGSYVFQFRNDQGNYIGKPEKRRIALRIIGFDESIQKIVLNKSLVRQYDNLEHLGNNSKGYFIDKDNILIVLFEWDHSGQTIKIKCK